MAKQPSLEYYGNPLVIYKGEGQLTFDSGQVMKCKFKAGQLRTSKVTLLCKFSDVHHLRNINSFQGRTSDNCQVSSTDVIMGIPWQEKIEVSDGIQRWAAFSLGKLMVESLPRERKKPQTLRFGLTNLSFIPIERVNGFPRRVLSLRLNTETATYEVVLDPISDYNERLDKVRTTKGVDVTCEAVVNVGDGQTIQELTQVLDNLCYILSVAGGTKINWIYRGVYSSDGSLLRRLHAARVTKPYAPLSIIDPRNPHETKAFIEKVYPVYINKKDSYRLDSGMIDAYLDAKQEADFLEMRGLKMVVAMEMIVWHIATVLGMSEKILDESEFKKLRTKLKHLIKSEILQGSQMKKNRCLVYSKIPELKRCSFRDMLRKIISPENIDLPLPDDELELFIRCRNALVHKGDFYCNTANNRDRVACPPKSTAVGEYFFLVNVLDRMFLKILEYRGTYIDCSHGFDRAILQ